MHPPSKRIQKFKATVTLLYTIYPTSCDLGTAEKAGLRPSTQSRVAVGSLALGHHNPTVCSLACHWQLRLGLRADKETFSIESGPLLDSKTVGHRVA